jgi:hypothetical protein
MLERILDGDNQLEPVSPNETISPERWWGSCHGIGSFDLRLIQAYQYESMEYLASFVPDVSINP